MKNDRNAGSSTCTYEPTARELLFALHVYQALSPDDRRDFLALANRLYHSQEVACDSQESAERKQ